MISRPLPLANTPAASFGARVQAALAADHVDVLGQVQVPTLIPSPSRDVLIGEGGTSPSRLVERVVAAGLVERRTDAEDRRYLQLGLTPEGRRLAAAAAEIEEHLHASMDAACEGLDTDGPERDMALAGT
ncbi:MarR family winged helix-turn-helix transcriptional regulator [Streptomyces sp. NPDC003863]